MPTGFGWHLTRYPQPSGEATALVATASAAYHVLAHRTNDAPRSLSPITVIQRVASTVQRPPPESATLISLFAGAGGLDLGLEEAGFVTVGVNELEAHACRTLEANRAIELMTPAEFEVWFEGQMQQRCYRTVTAAERSALRERISRHREGHSLLRYATILEGDLRKISSEELAAQSGVRRGEVSLVAGGPPCQPFSRAGKRLTVEIDEGRLFLEFVRVVRDLQPRWFLFENVKGLAQSKTTVVSHLCNRCRSRKIVPFEERDAALRRDQTSVTCECGGVHGRIEERTVSGGSLDIIRAEFERVGYHCSVALLDAADFGVAQRRERVFIVGSRDNEPFEWPAPTHGQNPLRMSAQRSVFDAEETLARWTTVAETLWPNGHPEYGALDPERAVLWVKNVVRPHDEPVTWTLDRPAPTVGAHQAAKLAIAPYGVPEEQLQRQQWHSLGRRQGDSPPVPVEHRYLTDEELLRLQTFPDFWYLYGTRMERAFQIGNAVPVRLAHVVGSALLGQRAQAPELSFSEGSH